MKKKKVKLFSKIMITLCLIAAIFVGGYFFLDKTIIPKYFGKYGINGISDLVGVVAFFFQCVQHIDLVTHRHGEIASFSIVHIILQMLHEIKCKNIHKIALTFVHYVNRLARGFVL